MMGSKMLDHDEGYTRVGRHVLEEPLKSLQAPSGRSQGRDDELVPIRIAHVPHFEVARHRSRSHPAGAGRLERIRTSNSVRDLHFSPQRMRERLWLSGAVNLARRHGPNGPSLSVTSELASGRCFIARKTTPIIPPGDTLVN